jgi:hypothetical protein
MLPAPLLVHPSLPGQSYNNPPAPSLHLYNNRHQIKKTPRNAPQPTDLIFRC